MSDNLPCDNGTCDICFGPPEIDEDTEDWTNAPESWIQDNIERELCGGWDD